MARTRRIDTNGPGIRRIVRGRGFSYHEEDGELITDAETIDRIEDLAIPPAWSDVWICPHPRGHIQATGYDDKGRKQYLYHPDWREHRDRIKFDEMLDFAEQLPALRRRISEGLDERGLVFDRVASCAVALLDRGLFRIGSERYEQENRSYGLTTLKCRHVSFERGEAVFSYPAKSGKRAEQRVSGERVLGVLKALRRRGDDDEDLLTYRTGRSDWHSLSSEEVNDFIKEIVGEGFSAKDFRTWNATVLAATFLAVHEGEADTDASRRRVANLAIRQTAEYLNNTPAVCRASYIDPRVFDRFDAGRTVREALADIEREADPGSFADREEIEAAVRDLLA